MRAFVTGGTGLLGSSVVKELLARGHDVVALVRRPDASSILGPPVRLVTGDLRDASGFERHLAGADVLIHAGACYGEYYRKGARALPGETNVKGTAALLDAAARQGVGNVVYVSSSAVLEGRQGEAVDERSRYLEETDDPYFASKVEAEKAVFRFLEASPGMRVVLVLPSVMVGPGDRGPTPTGSFVLRLLQGKIPFVLPGWHRIADVRDVASAVVEAIQRGGVGERFLVGGRRYEASEIYRTLTEVTGRPTPTKRISPRKLLLASRVMQLAGALTHRPPLIKPAIVRRLQEDFWYDSAKAERELGVRFRPLSETLADAASWFRSQGMA